MTYYLIVVTIYITALHQHMRWSREGLNPLLQIRAALHSQGEWSIKWQSAVLNAA